MIPEEEKLQYKKNIKSKLQKIFDDKFLIFKKLLMESGSIISGSFLVQCILNVVWNNSDIDIYVSNDNYKMVIDFFEKNYKKIKSNNEINYNDKEIISTEKFIVNNKSIEIIKLSSSNDKIHDYIINKFDFSICKNEYYVDKKGKNKLYVYDIDGIKNKKLIIKNFLQFCFYVLFIL